MDVKSLIRDASILDKVIHYQDGTLIAKKKLQIHIPFRYISAKLANIGKDVNTVAIFAIVVDGTYMVSNVCSNMQLTPSSIYSEQVDKEEYYILEFDAGSVITPRTSLVVDDTITYNVYDEFIGKAKLPWFINYEDIGKCVANAHYYSNIRLGGTNAVLELLVASIARDPDDIKKFYRETAKSLDTQDTNPPVILPFKSIISGTTNTMGKLIGSYFDEGLTSALTNEGGPPGVEDLFRL